MQRIVKLVAGCTAALTVGACSTFRNESARVEKKAEDYRRSGLARDMAEARRMAENYYWPETAKPTEGRTSNEFFPLKKDEKK